MIYVCDKEGCVGGEVSIVDGIVPKCWGFAGDDPHTMTKKYDPWEDYDNPLHPYRSRDLDRLL